MSLTEARLQERDPPVEALHCEWRPNARDPESAGSPTSTKPTGTIQAKPRTVAISSDPALFRGSASARPPCLRSHREIFAGRGPKEFGGRPGASPASRQPTSGLPRRNGYQTSHSSGRYPTRRFNQVRNSAAIIAACFFQSRFASKVFPPSFQPLTPVFLNPPFATCIEVQTD